MPRDDQTEDIYGDLLNVSEQAMPPASEPPKEEQPSPAEKTTPIRIYTISEHENFAPHVQNGLLSLATCMPEMRQSAAVGEWIAGIGPKTAGQQRLVFVAKITGEMTRAEYWETYGSTRKDNIYIPQPEGGFKQLPNAWHKRWRIKYDMKSNRVLLSTKYYNFSRGHYGKWTVGDDYLPKDSGIEIPPEFSFLRPGYGVRGSGKFVHAPDSFFEWLDGQPQEELQTLDNRKRILS